MQIPVCNDGGGSEIQGYLFETQWNGSVARRLEKFECDIFPAQRNNTPAARELTQWIRKIRNARAAEHGHR